jgi:hypothetical protein
MAGISANTNRILAQKIVDLYNSAENSIMAKMTARLKTDLDSPLWEQKKLKMIRQMRQDVEEQIAILDLELDKAINGIIAAAYKEGLNGVDLSLIQQGIAARKNGQLYFKNQLGFLEQTISMAFGKIDQTKVEAMAKALTDQLKSTHPQIIRAADDIYRQIITDSAMQMITGTATRLEAIRAALNKFANMGITNFIDKAGRHWSLSAYADMACRSNLVQANLSGTMSRMEELGVNLVIVSTHSGSDDKCLPWEGKVLRLE